MATSPEYYAFLSEQLSHLSEISFRPMMGEYVVYYRGKVIGGIYDDRFLVKSVSEAKRMMPDAPSVRPYPGAAVQLLVENVEDRDFLESLVFALFRSLPEPKPGKKRS